MDIHSLLDRPGPALSSANGSTTSRTSPSVKAETEEEQPGSVRTSVTAATTPTVYPGYTNDISGPPYPYPMMQTAPYPQPYSTAPSHYQPWSPTYQPYPSSVPLGASRLAPPMSIPMSHHEGQTNKRVAPPHPHPAEPAKKKQSKWSADEDASIIELRGNGMKWEDISKHLPGRSAISCRLRFQNYLERRSEWDEEKKNKLARLYERYVESNLLRTKSTDVTQVQEGYVGEDFERDAITLARGGSHALANWRNGNGATRQRTGLPSCWTAPVKSAAYQHHIAIQNAQHLSFLRTLATHRRLIFPHT